MFRIEQGQADTAPQIAAFAARTFLAAYGEKNTPDHVAAYVASAFDTDEIRRQLESPGTLYLLGFQDDELVAYVKLVFDQRVEELPDTAPAQLERIYVDANQQGGGIGKRMLTAASETAKSHGATSLWLSAWEENNRAHAFYERHGFVVSGKTHFMLGPERQEDLIMVLDLHQSANAKVTGG